MATSVVPALIDALVTQLTAALPNVLVIDGVGVTENPGDFLMIGVEDPDQESAAFSADVRQSWAGLGAKARDEEGEITCAALAWTGNSDPTAQKAARDAAYAILATVENTLRTTPTLGVAGVRWVSFGTQLTLSQAQGTAGADALVVFRINFQARI